MHWQRWYRPVEDANAIRQALSLPPLSQWLCLGMDQRRAAREDLEGLGGIPKDVRVIRMRSAVGKAAAADSDLLSARCGARVWGGGIQGRAYVKVAVAGGAQRRQAKGGD